MKYGTMLRNSAFIIAASLFTLASCKHDNNNNAPALTNADDNGGYASDAAKAEQTSNDVISIADVAAATSSGSNLRTTGTTLGGCAMVTNDTSVTPHVLTINFGTTDCTCLDNKNRRGEIIVTYSGHYKDSGSTHTITYSNYYVNDNQVMGSKTVTNMGTNSSGQVYYNVTVNDSMGIGSDSLITWVGNRVRTWYAGYGTSERADDVYQITGTTTLTRANGHVFTFDITSPLQVANACPFIEAGTVDISSSTFASSPHILDYGTGNCDDEAQLTIGGTTYNVTLR